MIENIQKKMAKLLTIYGETKTWTEGNHAWFDVKLRKGSSVTVFWGDGNTSTIAAPYYKDSWCRAEHLYRNPKVVTPYIIEFFSDDCESVLEIVDGLWETNPRELVIDDCQSLTALTFHQLECMNLRGCPHLSYLDCESFRSAKLELNSLSELKCLHCKNSEIVSLDISDNPKIEILGLYGCRRLRSMRINNRAPLVKVCIDFCESLTPPTQVWLTNKVHENGGEIVDWLSGDYFSMGVMTSK
jgi:hypothetical protein